MQRIVEIVIEEILKSQAVTKIMLFVFFSAFSLVSLVTIKYFNKVLRKIEFLTYFVKASDKACEEHMQNGYAKTRDSELAKMLKENDFVSKWTWFK